MRCALLVSSAFLFALSGAAQAELLEDDAGTIVVTGQREAPYRAASISSATRTDTPLLDVPQAITVLTRQRLDDQAILSVADALRSGQNCVTVCPVFLRTTGKV